jgi:ankyrin repeat protein
LGQRAIVKTLIKAGADVNAVDGEGMTALTLAACCAGQDVIKLLLESGADKSVRDIHGKVPLDYTELKSIRKLLL